MLPVFLIEYLNIAVTHIGSLFIVIFPMWNTRDVSRRFVFLLIGAFALLAGVGLFIFRGFVEVDIDFIHMYRTAIAPPALSFAFFIFRKKVWQNIFLMSIAFLYAPITTGTGQYIGEMFFAENVMLATSVVNIGVIAITLPLLLFMLRRLCGNENMKQAIIFWRFFWLVPAIFFVMILATSSHFSMGYFSDNFIMVRVLTYIMLLLICYLFDNAVRQISKAEAARRALEEHAAKTEFLQDMSHEMKAPLTVIATGIDYANATITDGDADKSRETLEIIRNETHRLGRIVRGMANLAAMSETGANRKRTDFSALLKDSAEAYRAVFEKQDTALRVEIAPDLPDVFIETDRFKQVITNLFSNAANHTKNGAVKLTAQADENCITVRVTDTGGGIPPEALPTVFERGTSGDDSTGYGLHICKTIVEAHGGTINIESKPSGGTAVTFTVPAYGGQTSLRRSL